MEIVPNSSNSLQALASDHGEHGGHGDEDHDEVHHEEGGEEWLISYADLMTLLFGLFAMMFSFAQFDDGATVRVEKSLLKYFGGTYADGRPINDPGTETMKAQLEKDPSLKDIELRDQKDKGLTFVTRVLFPVGRGEPTPEAVQSLKKLAGLIKDTKKNYKIRIEGHTDDTPMAGVLFPTNWELSASRAASVVRIFEGQGFKPETLEATGFGSSRPVFPNRDEKGMPIAENQNRNRRIEIKVISEEPEKPAESTRTVEPEKS